MSVPAQNFSASEEKWISSNGSGTAAWPGAHSWLPCSFMREVITPQRHCMWRYFGDGKGRRVAGKIFLIFTMSAFLGFYPPMVCLNLPLGSWTSVSLLFSFLCRSGGIEWLCCSAFSTADIKICLPIAICTHGQDSFWVSWHVAHTDVFVCGWMSNSLLNKGTDGQLSYAT